VSALTFIPLSDDFFADSVQTQGLSTECLYYPVSPSDKHHFEQHSLHIIIMTKCMNIASKRIKRPETTIGKFGSSKGPIKAKAQTKSVFDSVQKSHLPLGWRSMEKNIIYVCTLVFSNVCDVK